MLVLVRRVGEKIRIGDNIIVTVIRCKPDGVVIGLEAPSEVPIHRQEVWEAIRREEGQRGGAAPSVPDND